MRRVSTGAEAVANADTTAARRCGPFASLSEASDANRIFRLSSIGGRKRDPARRAAGANVRIMRRRGVLCCASALAILLVPSRVHAHFYIDYPDASDFPGPSPEPWWHEDSFGSPQKLGPCGDEDDSTDAGGGPTGAVTPFVEGQTITLQWTEIVSHAGWYRVAIASSRDDFIDPPVQVDSSGNSADAGIEDPPVLPVIADGIYRHAIESAPITWPPFTITLPATPCAKCTIQLIQVMLDHPSNLGMLRDGAPNPDGFLYHHCIDVSILPADGGPVPPLVDAGARGADDAGAVSTSASDGGGSADRSPSSGCTCALGGERGKGAAAPAMLGVAVALFRRRARRTRAPARS
jgi:hypothetical protein